MSEIAFTWEATDRESANLMSQNHALYHQSEFVILLIWTLTVQHPFTLSMGYLYSLLGCWFSKSLTLIQSTFTLNLGPTMVLIGRNKDFHVVRAPFSSII
jgi:hypothetical protein